MSLEGNSPQVKVGKEPKQRTQHYQTHINMTKTTAEKEDAHDSTATRQHTKIAAEKEDATDSTAHKTAKKFKQQQARPQRKTAQIPRPNLQSPTCEGIELARKRQAEQIQQQPCLG